MRDCFDILITKYYAALNGNITYNSANVPIYDRVPKNTTFPYIIFQSYTGVDESNKSNYMKEVTVTVQVVTGFDLEQGGKEESDNIADQILQIIRERPDNLLDLSPNFNLINVSVDDTSSYEQTTETHLIVYRNIRFRHKVEQLTDYFNTNFLCATAKPTNLTATAVSTSQINLSWTDNSGGAATFSIERSTTYVNGFTVIATPVAGTTVYNDTGLVAGTTYFYRIRALDTCYSRYSDIAFDCTETSGGACADATAVLKDTAGSTISITTIASGGTENITAPDGVVTITDTTPSTLYTVNVKSDGTETQAIADSVITLNNSVPTLISTTNVKAEATATIVAPDATAVIKDSVGTTLKTEAIPSGASEDIIISDGNCEVFNTALDMVAQGSITAEGYLSLEAPDGIVRVRKSDSVLISSQSVPSGGLVNYNVADSTININSSLFTTVKATETANIPVKNTAADNVGSDNTGVWEVADATIENSDASYSTTVAAEGTKILPDITLTQPNGSTEAKKSNINLSCTQINALADSDLISQLTNAQVQAVIESRLTCKPVNPNFQNIHSSVLPSSYATGDWRSQYNAGYINNITYSELDRVYMLDNALNLSAYTPNPFGHTKRFTGRTGSYYDEVSNTWKDKNGSGVADHATAFPNGAVYDHYTGRAFQSTLNALGSSINFADTASAAAALTTNGLTWRIPTIAEHLSSVAVTIALNTSSINPSCHFNTTTGKIFIHATATLIAWCADVHPSTTANNYCVRYTTTTSLVVSDARTTASSRGGFAVANFTTSDLTL